MQEIFLTGLLLGATVVKQKWSQGTKNPESTHILIEKKKKKRGSWKIGTGKYPLSKTEDFGCFVFTFSFV